MIVAGVLALALLALAAVLTAIGVTAAIVYVILHGRYVRRITYKLTGRR